MICPMQQPMMPEAVSDGGTYATYHHHDQTQLRTIMAMILPAPAGSNLDDTLGSPRTPNPPMQYLPADVAAEIGISPASSDAESEEYSEDHMVLTPK